MKWLQPVHVALTAVCPLGPSGMDHSNLYRNLNSVARAVAHCVLNPLENENSESIESVTMVRASEWFGIPLEDFKKGFLLINSVAPSFFQMGRLAGALQPQVV